MSPGELTGLPSMVLIWSPAWMPATDAGESMMIETTLPGLPLSWVRPKPVISTMATRKLATGPAARIAMRWYAGREWNPSGCSNSPASMPPMRT